MFMFPGPGRNIRLAKCGSHSLRWRLLRMLLGVHALCSLLSYRVRVDFRDQRNIADVITCTFWGQIIKDIVTLPYSLLDPLLLRKPAASLWGCFTSLLTDWQGEEWKPPVSLMSEPSWEWILQPQSRLQITSPLQPHEILSQNDLAKLLSEFLSHRNCEIANVCFCFKTSKL